MEHYRCSVNSLSFPNSVKIYPTCLDRNRTSDEHSNPKNLCLNEIEIKANNTV